MRILFADADPVQRGILCLLLQKAGHRVTTRECGLRTLRTLQERQFDLLIVSAVLPNLSAAELLRQMPERNAGIRCVVLCRSRGEAEGLSGCEILMNPLCSADLLALTGVALPPKVAGDTLEEVEHLLTGRPAPPVELLKSIE